jgi:hypothetical protein
MRLTITTLLVLVVVACKLQPATAEHAKCRALAALHYQLAADSCADRCIAGSTDPAACYNTCDAGIVAQWQTEQEACP